MRRRVPGEGKRFRLRKYGGLTAFAAAIAAATVVLVPSALGSGAAAYTTAIDDGSGNPAGCLNGHGIDCNNYVTKNDVYVNGGPTSGAGLPEGSYYFAVLVPGFQHDGFIQGHEGNLSDTTTWSAGKTAGFDNGSGDSQACRLLAVDGSGDVSYVPGGDCAAAHSEGPWVTDPSVNVTQLMPYNDTSNNGGVYILAVCKVGATSSRDCKFDAFRIAQNEVPDVDDLIVSKTAAPKFMRTYNWDSAKSLTSSGSVRTSATSATASYSVTARWGGPTDTGWEVDGQISVTNPNDVDAPSVDVTDTLSTGGSLADGGTADNNASCVVTGGTGLTIAAHDSVDLDYACSWAAGTGPLTSDGAYAGYTNNAHVTWDNSGDFKSPGASADATAAAAFGDGSAGNPTLVNNAATVTDAFNGNAASKIADVNVNGTWSNLAAGATAAYNSLNHTFTFTYSRTLTVDQNGCTAYPNTVAITGITDSTPGDNSASVTVCPTVTGLTIGYWGNKNGQAKITTSASASGVCNLTGSLRQYAPLQDLSATASCSAVASYVLGVVKNATCTSTSKTCNSMLKAQMVATALNVYFGATNGNEKIDLVHGCKMIDSTNGTATCNSSENWSSAFGGATSLTVLQMLAYAASQSNVSGSSWYGQAKATQVIAKDAFDAINNGVALSA